MIRYKAEDMVPPSDRLYGIYRGVVEDREDPLKAGRVRVRVFGVHTERKDQDLQEGIPTDELPWAEPAMGLVEGSVSGFGLWSVPLQGSHVFVFFEMGNIMQPRYFATVPGIPQEGADLSILQNIGFQDPDGEYPLKAIERPFKPNAVGEPDVHKFARGLTQFTIFEEKRDRREREVETAIEGDEGPETWDEPMPYFEARYPENIVLATHGGFIIEIDNTVTPAQGDTPEEGKRRIHVYHPSNTFVEVNEDGDMVVKNDRDKFEIVVGDKKIYIKGNEDKTVDGEKTELVRGEVTEKFELSIDRRIEKDLNESIGNDRNIDVAQDDTEEIGNDKTVNIGRGLSVVVGDNCSVEVGSNCDITIGANCNITASGVVNVKGATINLN